MATRLRMVDKLGNATFVRCPSCREWFTVATKLIDAATIALCCPACTRRFLPEEAAEIDRP